MKADADASTALRYAGSFLLPLERCLDADGGGLVPETAIDQTRRNANCRPDRGSCNKFLGSASGRQRLNVSRVRISISISF